LRVHHFDDVAEFSFFDWRFGWRSETDARIGNRLGLGSGGEGESDEFLHVFSLKIDFLINLGVFLMNLDGLFIFFYYETFNFL